MENFPYTKMPVVHFSRIKRSFQVPTFRTWKTAAFYPHLIHFKPVSAFHIVAIRVHPGADPAPELTDAYIRPRICGGVRGYPPPGNFEI